jgi:hypothetical protein
VAAASPNNVMNSRRRTSSIGSSPASGSAIPREGRMPPLCHYSLSQPGRSLGQT